MNYIEGVAKSLAETETEQHIDEAFSPMSLGALLMRIDLEGTLSVLPDNPEVRRLADIEKLYQATKKIYAERGAIA